MLVITVNNNKCNSAGRMENASISHQELFSYLSNAKGLQINLMSCLASPDMKNMVMNNMPKYVSFSDTTYDSSHLIGDHIFKNHTISIKRSNTPAKLVTFLCVPPWIDDDEFIHLVQHFGSISNMNISHDCHKDPMVKGVPNGNRSVEVELY